VSNAPLVPTSDARAALEHLTRDPPPLVNRLMGSAYRPLGATDERIAAKDVREAAEKLGFRFLGRYDMMGILPFILRPKRERYVDSLGIVALSARRGTSRGPAEAAMSKYFLVTYFDDGSCVTTWAKSSPPVQSAERMTERGGTGDLDFDYKSHLEAVTAQTSKGKKALLVPDLETSLALGHYYDTYLRPGSVVSLMTTRVLLLALIVFGIVKWLRR
jgi:hypothetical protein